MAARSVHGEVGALMKTVTLIAAAIAGLAGFGWTLVTAKGPESPARGDAASYAQASESPNRWTGYEQINPAERIRQLQAILVENPGDVGSWHLLGWAQHHAGDEPAALASWQKAASLHAGAEPSPPDSGYLYNLACYRALAGDREGALTAWARCVESGWDRPGMAEWDPDLESIRTDPRFVEAFKKIVPGPGGVMRLGAG
jgi:cytochrome c-type biogenesis protein CcmH/NrfG